MADLLTKAEFLAHIEPMRASLAELAKLQREANGRTGKVEARVAVLEDRSPAGTVADIEARIQVLEDRSPGRAGMMAGGLMAGLVTVLALVFEALKRARP